MTATHEAEFIPGDRTIGRPPLPPGEAVDLPGRGTTFVRRVAGRGHGPTILLLHGWTVTGAINWFPHYTELAAIGPVISVDHRGHGRGIRTDEPFLLEDAADDTAALIETLGCGPVVLVGYSMGGAIAQLLARRRPDLVAGLLLSATWSNGPSTPRMNRILRLAGAGSKAVRALPEERQRALVERAFEIVQGRDTAERPAWFVDELRSASVPHVLDAGRELARFDSRPWLAELRMPTTVLVTSRDTVVMPGFQHELASRIGHAVIASAPIDHAGVVTDAGDYRGPLVDAVTALARRAG